MRKKIDHRLGKLWSVVLGHLPLDPGLLVLTPPHRSKYLNRQLAWPLAFVAGAVNAGGFLACGIYTSHVSGSISRIMDELALGHLDSARKFLFIVFSFFLGAFSSATFVHLGKRRRFRSPYGGLLFVEALLLIAFGALMNSKLKENVDVSGLAALGMSFFMGALNAVATKISGAEVRVTHMTGVLTDLGIEISRSLYWHRTVRPKSPTITANWSKIRLHGGILAAFMLGGISGALGFSKYDYDLIYALALILLALAFRPFLYDLRIRARVVSRQIARKA
jgi:uncharacterized membrane protein YoaK (UPF0700 family)